MPSKADRYRPHLDEPMPPLARLPSSMNLERQRRLAVLAKWRFHCAPFLVDYPAPLTRTSQEEKKMSTIHVLKHRPTKSRGEGPMRRQRGRDGDAYLLPPRPAPLNPRPQRFPLTRLSLYRPLPPTPAAGPVGGCFAVLGVVSVGSSNPYEPSTTMSLSGDGRVGVGADGVLPTLA